MWTCCWTKAKRTGAHLSPESKVALVVVSGWIEVVLADVAAVEVLDTSSVVAVAVDGLTVVSPLVNPCWVLLGPSVTIKWNVIWLELLDKVATGVVGSCVLAGLVVEGFFRAARFTFDRFNKYAKKKKKKTLSFPRVRLATTYRLGRKICVCRCSPGHSTSLHVLIWQRHSRDLLSSWVSIASSSGRMSHCRRTTSIDL